MTDICMCRDMCSILWRMGLATPNAGPDKRSRSLRAHCLTSLLAWRAARPPSASLTQCCYTSAAGEHTFLLYRRTDLMAFPLESSQQSMAGKTFSIASPTFLQQVSEVDSFPCCMSMHLLLGSTLDPGWGCSSIC